MILAAGRGERLRPLTDAAPKPLLGVGGKPLIAWHLENLAAAGCKKVVVNLGWRGEQIRDALGDGSPWGLQVQYSDEQQFEDALETGGGIHHALGLLGDQPFLVVNGDIWSDYDFHSILNASTDYAHLVLVPNPADHPLGDFALEDGRVRETGDVQYTFSGIGLYHPRFFETCSAGRFPLAPLLRQAMRHDRVSGEFYTGRWRDAGTPERFRALENELSPR